MYPQFADGQTVRGLPDMGRNAARFPYHQYYHSKIPEGLSSYPPGMPRPNLNPYGGKPPHDPLYGGHMPWNSMMVPPGMVPPQMQKPMMTNKPDYSFPGQDQMYRPPYHPDMMNSAGASGGFPGYMYPVGAYHHQSSYLPPPSMPPPPPPPHAHHQMDGYGIPHQTNSIWDGSSSVSSANLNSPGRSWSGGHQEIMSDAIHHAPPPAPPPGYQSSQSPQPAVAGATNELQKGSSVSSLKDALSNPPPPQSLHDSSLSATSKSFQFNTPSYLSVGGESMGHASPRTPNAVGTPDPATPSIPGIIPNNEPSSSPLQPPQQQNDLGPHGNGTSRPTSHSPFEVDSILGFNKDSNSGGSGGVAGGGVSTENGEPFPFSKSPHEKSISPTSSTNSPAITKKTRTPSFSTVTRTHPSLANQYNMSDEPGRRDFLDAIFKYMDQKNIPYLKPPSISKCVLDLYKTFTAVQRLGGFTHVVDKKLWKEVLKSFCTSNNPSSASMRTLSEYYVKVLLPYECHFSHTNFSDCMSHYELSHHPQSSHPPPPPPPPPTSIAANTVNSNSSESTASEPLPPPNEEIKNETESNKQQQQQQQQKDQDEQQLDKLLDSNSVIFSEDSLPDISVQEAESVLGIPTSSSGPQPTTPSPSFPPGWSSPGGGGGGEQAPSMSDSPMVPSPYQSGLVHHHSGGFPGYYSQGAGGMSDYSPYQQKTMSPYMTRGMYPGYHDEGSYNYQNMMMRSRMDEYNQHAMGGMGEWHWTHPSMQQRPHLPPPLPPHLQSMMFTPPPLSLSPRPSTPHQQHTHTQHHQSSGAPPAGPGGVSGGGAMSESDSSSPVPMDPIKIVVTDQGAPNQTPPTSAVDKVMTTPPHKNLEKDIKPVPPQHGSVKDISEKSSPIHQQQQQLKRPVDPIETLQPQLSKRRRLNCDHCGNVQPWHVMMSLKCGLPAESTWALDTLTILLHDDRTVGFFYLKHHHSLLNTLVNHFNTCLYQIFGHPFQQLDKFDSRTASTDSTSPTASVYHHSSNDIRLGLADHVCHFVQSSAIIDVLAESLPQCHPLVKLEKDKRVCQHVDETRVDELLKRDALTERVLLHLKTPRRLMARSPIQKYFLPPQPEEEESGGVAKPASPLREENEVLKCEPLPLCLIPSQQEALKYRTLSLSNILRSLSFIPGNDIEFSQHPGLLIILGHLLLLHHAHLHCQSSSKSSEAKSREEEEEEEGEGVDRLDADLSSPTITEEYWWWSCLDVLRENTFVILANIGGQLDFSLYPEAITYPVLTGLLHWLVCPSSVATDPLPDSAMVYSLSPQRLVVEALAKISISEANVDFILATPPLTRLDLVYSTLLQFVGQKKYPAVRQFALVLLSDLAQGSEGASRMIGQQKMTLPLLLECLESSLNISKTRYMSAQYADDASALSLAMLRRAAVTLHCIAKVPVNRISFLPYCNRVLTLGMSDALDPSLSSILSDVLYELTRLL